MFLSSAAAFAQQGAGSIRGVVYDADFDAPLPLARVLVADTGQEALTSDEGNYLIEGVAPGTYTVVVSKDGYVRQVRADVVVVAGRLTDLDASLTGEFTEMEEFVVQDILLAGAGSEAALLQLRFDSPSLMDSIGSDLMSRAGASDAAAALTLVSGASVQDGKFAVIRGLPDRYVSSQMNGVRLPTADEDKRAVELDQFPAAVIESIQVSKTFTPDQQGDASGGAVDVRLKSIPDEPIFQIKAQTSYNTQASGESDFLSYHGGGVNTLGDDHGSRDVQPVGTDWDGAVGVDEQHAPIDYKFSIAGGGKHVFDNGVKVGGFASLFYERDSSFFDDGKDDSYWVEHPGEGLVPAKRQDSGADDFKTALFDVTQGTESVQWGGLGTFGVETENHSVNLTYLYTRTAEDKATLAEDTRGKEYFFPGYDPNDRSTPGHDEFNAAPYLRLETLDYTERTTQTLQLAGRHVLPLGGFGIGDAVRFEDPKLDWTIAKSSATLDEPDKRQFGTVWRPAREPIPGFIVPASHRPYKPDAVSTLGWLQRIYEGVEEDSDQFSLNLEWPFEQWTATEGYLKFGWFDDSLDRTFDQDTYSNFSDPNNSFDGEWDEPWSEVFPDEDHIITGSDYDVDYTGKQDISAVYGMIDLPLTAKIGLVGGARFESTEIGIVNDPEEKAEWYPAGSITSVALHPGDADVDFSQDDVLPSIGLVYEPIEQITLRGSYSETVARQTFKELSPILQQEFAGSDVFVGNPDLGMAALKNYDLRVDCRPYEGGLFSVSWFYKDIEDPIEYVQRVIAFTFTTPVNYPEGKLSGWELEARQDLGRLWEPLEGFSVGANATFIDSEVTLPDDEAARFEVPNVNAPMRTRDATNAPEHLYNLYLTYDWQSSGTRAGLFYTVKGDTLVAGAGTSDNNFVPNVYAKEFDTLNFTLSQRIGKNWQLRFQAKNLTDPSIDEVYRSSTLDGDTTKTSYTKGIEFSLGIGVSF